MSVAMRSVPHTMYSTIACSSGAPHLHSFPTLCVLLFTVSECMVITYAQCVEHVHGGHDGSCVFLDRAWLRLSVHVISLHHEPCSGNWYICCAHSLWRSASIPAAASIRIERDVHVVVVQCVLSCVLCLFCWHDS